jgi:hypothetical protein
VTARAHRAGLHLEPRPDARLPYGQGGQTCGVARRCGRGLVGKQALLWAAAVTGFVAALSFPRVGDDLDDVLWRFGTLATLAALTALVLLGTARSQNRAYDAAWRRVCHVLGDDHRHCGKSVTGTWRGRPFQAFATTYSLDQNGGTVMEYRVTMPAGASGPAWAARRAGSELWSVRSDLWSAEHWLIDAGLLDTLEVFHLPGDARLSFRPLTGDIAYEDGSGEPPCAGDLAVHLDLVRRAADVHAAAMAAHGADLAGDQWQSHVEPPLWVQGLFVPAGLVALAAGDRWIWGYLLLPLALLAPTLWRQRSGGRGHVTASG